MDLPGDDMVALRKVSPKYPGRQCLYPDGVFAALWNGASWLLGTNLLALPVEAYLHALSMVAAGICFGFFRQTSRSLTVPMMVHILAIGAILLF